MSKLQGMKRKLYGLQKALASNDGYIRLLRKKGACIGSGCFIDKTAVFGSEPYLISIGNEVRITRGV